MTPPASAAEFLGPELFACLGVDGVDVCADVAEKYEASGGWRHGGRAQKFKHRH